MECTFQCYVMTHLYTCTKPTYVSVTVLTSRKIKHHLCMYMCVYIIIIITYTISLPKLYNSLCSVNIHREPWARKTIPTYEITIKVLKTQHLDDDELLLTKQPVMMEDVNMMDSKGVDEDSN